MQQLKQKIKPPFLLDGVYAAKRGKVLDYRAEQDSHLEQYFFNMQMRQQMIKMKQDKISSRNLAHQQSKSFEQTINQQNEVQVQNLISSPKHQTTSKVSISQNDPKESRSLSKEHFVTFLDSLITTVQNVQQLVNTYFPQEKNDNQIAKQQNELSKISQATEQLSRQLRGNSIPNKKEVENVKTQKNFSKLPQIKKNDVNVNLTKSGRGRDVTQKSHNSPKSNNINPSKTLEKTNNLQLDETNHHNFYFEQYQSVQDNINKKTIQDKPIEQIKSQRDSQPQKLLQLRSGKTTQLPSVRSSQQKSAYQYKKYQKEVQLILTKPKQNYNDQSISFVSQSPEQLKSKSVGIRDNQQQNQSKNLNKPNFKKITSINITQVEQQKSKSNLKVQNNFSKRQNTSQIQIKIIDVDKQIIIEPPKNLAQVEVVEEVVQNFSKDSGNFLIEKNQNKEVSQTQDEDKSKFNGTAFFKIAQGEEIKESIGKMTESNEIQRFNDNEQDSQKQLKQNENTFIKMIQNQVIENDLKLLKQQQTNYNTLNDVEKGSETLIKAVESIDPLSDNDDIVNPLEDSDNEQKQNQSSMIITTLMQNSLQVLVKQNQTFEQEQ
ncbi:unnamed protein product [Paramecium sonneborni]|uniref:Uncharacterized protein n=1 Tax=Paramecium sonneborni TaxID=65129 RepID=A0A8S1N154_9CILI|nr:unnamed protein product [Paramecium sonneborni]